MPAAHIEDALAPLVAIGLSVARPLGVAMVTPVFTRINLGTPVKAGFAIALALPHVSIVLDTVRDAGIDPMRLAMVGVKEVLAGLLIGLLIGLPIWAFQSAGELLDTQRSAPASGGSDPGGGGQQSATGELLSLVSAVLFVAAGGLGTIASTIYGSYRLWPLLRLAPVPQPGAGDALLSVLDGVGRVTLMAAAPITLLMLLADTAVMLIGKAVPKLGVFDLGATLRNLMFVVGLAFYAVYLVEFMGTGIAGLRITGRELGRFLDGGTGP